MLKRVTSDQHEQLKKSIRQLTLAKLVFKVETRFGGKKKNLFGVSVEGAYGTDNSYGASASVDYNEFLFVEGSYGVSDGVTTNSIAGKVKFRF